MRLGEVQALLDQEKYAIKARLHLAEIDAELLKTGYDAAAHDEIRLAEASGRASEASLRELEQARAALAPLGREIAELVVQMTDLEAETLREKSAYDQAAEVFRSSASQSARPGRAGTAAAGS